MNEDKTPQKPMSIEQAGNFLKEQSTPEVMAAKIKKKSKEHPISCALPEDRKRYLNYVISLLQDVSETTKYAWCNLTGKAAGIYTTKEVATIFRSILTLRVQGWSYEHVAKYLHTLSDNVKKTENLAKKVLKDIIAVKRDIEVPIIGGFN